MFYVIYLFLGYNIIHCAIIGIARHQLTNASCSYPHGDQINQWVKYIIMGKGAATRGVVISIKKNNNDVCLLELSWCCLIGSRTQWICAPGFWMLWTVTWCVVVGDECNVMSYLVSGVVAMWRGQKENLCGWRAAWSKGGVFADAIVRCTLKRKQSDFLSNFVWHNSFIKRYSQWGIRYVLLNRWYLETPSMISFSQRGTMKKIHWVQPKWQEHPNLTRLTKSK